MLGRHAARMISICLLNWLSAFLEIESQLNGFSIHCKVRTMERNYQYAILFVIVSYFDIIVKQTQIYSKSIFVA